MKFTDLLTGYTLETDNSFVVDQYKKNPERYKELKVKKTSDKTEK